MLPILLTFNFPGKSYGAGGETRTRDPNLGKVVLYQLSYTRSMFLRLRLCKYNKVACPCQYKIL